MNPEFKNRQLPLVKGSGFDFFYDINEKADPAAIDLISKLLVYDPKKRLKPFKAMCHPFFD
jgi:glycogen synthase kinase 3 beta